MHLFCISPLSNYALAVSTHINRLEHPASCYLHYPNTRRILYVYLCKAQSIKLTPFRTKTNNSVTDAWYITNSQANPLCCLSGSHKSRTSIAFSQRCT